MSSFEQDSVNLLEEASMRPHRGGGRRRDDLVHFGDAVLYSTFAFAEAWMRST